MEEVGGSLEKFVYCAVVDNYEMYLNNIEFNEN